ncbi:innexin inx4-like, partial [Chironomus tepperi]|uniref:innexin inx4-like n=1 Tax=Chironomus tepperi TaxID=113505 RepID=UPI00391F4969
EPTSCKLSDKARYDVMDYECWINGDYSSYMNTYSSNPRYQQQEFLKIGFYGLIVPLLVLQALCLIAPRVHWHYKQEQTIPKTLKKLHTKEISDDWINQRTQLINYIKHVDKSYHQLFATKYMFCELITIILIIIIMLLMSLVINDFWYEYRSAATSLFMLDFSRLYLTSSRIFPKQADCHFYTYEVNIYTKHRNGVCVFPQNVFNDKIFAILYIWYIFILTWSILNFIILIAKLSFKCLRLKEIRRMLGRPATIWECKYLSENGDYGLWFTLRIFRRNMHLVHFQDLCTELLNEVASIPNTL